MPSHLVNRSIARLGAAFGTIALCVLLAPPATAHAQQATIAGRVIDAATLQPIQGAQVIVTGTPLGALTDDQGQYRIVGVSAGSVELSARRIGYQSGAQTVTVTAGQTTTADFTLSAAAVSLERVVVTATGEQRNRELGSSIGHLDAADVMAKNPVPDLTSLLHGRVAGVTVQNNSGSVGTASTLKIRGSSSLGLDNTPIVYVDGARIDNSNQVSAGVGGQNYTRLNDINPSDIESIEVVKGPAAATLYGTEAAGGVIRITTKKGRAGETRYTFQTEQGVAWDPTDWWSMAWNPAEGLGLEDLLGVTPAKDTTYTFSLLEGAGPYKSPFRNGYQQNYGVTVSGGANDMSYFVSGAYTNDEGDLPNNDIKQYQVRGNFQLRPSDKVNITVANGFVSSTTHLPDNDNNLFGLIGNALGTSWNGPLTRPDPTTGGDPVATCFLAYEYARSTGASLTDATTDMCGSPYFVTTDNSNEKIFSRNNQQDVERYTGSGTLTYQPFGFWTNRFTVGYDEFASGTFNVVPVDPDRPFGEESDGFIDRASTTARNLSLNATSSVDVNLADDITSATTIGAQWFRQTTQFTEAVGRRFPAGSPSVGNAVENSGNDGFFETRTVGVFAQEVLGWKNRVFITPGVRFDDNSAFGSELGIKTYPHISASWIVSEESWFPDFFQQLKLRASWGESGKQPGPNDALALLTPVAVSTRDGDELGVTSNRPGNPELKPETSKEFETGFDASIFDGRVGLEFTYYDKQTEDAIVARQDAPSLGFPGNRFVNIGELSNKGVEAALDATVLNRSNLNWHWRVSYAHNKNEVTKLPDPIVFGSQRHQQGFPFGSYFARPVTLENGVAVVAEDPVFLGQPAPKWEGGVSSTLTLFGSVSLYAQLDYAGGHQLLNGLEEFSCALFGGGGQFGSCPEIFEKGPNGEFTNDALIKDAGSAAGTDAPFIYDADYAKLRTVSLTFNLPSRWLSPLGADRATLTFAGNNLATFTNYPGTDPEVNFAGSDQVIRQQLWTLPPARRFSTRLTLTF